MASSFSYYYSHPKIRLVPLDVVRDVRDVASRTATTNHSPGRRRARQLVFGAYCCSGTLPDQFWVGKFQCAGSVTFGPTASTTPDASSPMITGNSGTGSVPRR